ncbi:hypothetical protein [Paraclostridium bifermentans]
MSLSGCTFVDEVESRDIMGGMTNTVFDDENEWEKTKDEVKKYNEKQEKENKEDKKQDGGQKEEPEMKWGKDRH